MVNSPMFIPCSPHLSAHVFSARRFSICTLANAGSSEAKVAHLMSSLNVRRVVLIWVQPKVAYLWMNQRS